MCDSIADLGRAAPAAAIAARGISPVKIRAAFAALLVATPASAEPLSCPRVLRTTQDALDVPRGLVAEEGPADWSILAYVEFYTGAPVPVGRDLNPVRHAVPPTEQSPLGRTLTATWDFSGADEDVWLACHYHATRMYLLLPVPPQAVRCSVTWARGESGAIMPSAIQRIECD